MKRLFTIFFKHKILIIVIALTLVISGFYYQNKKKADAAKLEKTAKVEKGTLKESIILSGEVKAKENTSLHFQTSGRLAGLRVNEGDVVKKGQLIAYLDQRDLKKRLAKELNDYKTTRWDYDQTVDDSKNKAVTTAMQRIIDASQFALDNSVLDVELQTISIEFANLTSPIQGLVVSKGNFQPGMNISAADTIVEIVNPDSLYFEVTADQTEVTKIHEGMQGALTLDAYVDESLTGVINHISFSPETNESGTVYGIELQFNNSSNQNLRYRLGMTGDVEFVLKEKPNVLYLPSEFIKSDEKGNFVQIMKGNKKEKAYVTIGLETESDTEIVKGLNEGDIIYD
jgi:RND family efflux transporter MFP subunit